MAHLVLEDSRTVMINVDVIGRLAELFGNSDWDIVSKAIQLLTTLVAFGKQSRVYDVRRLTLS